MVAWLEDDASMFHDNDMQLESACRKNKLQSQYCLQKHHCMSLIQVAKRCDESSSVLFPVPQACERLRLHCEHVLFFLYVVSLPLG